MILSCWREAKAPLTGSPEPTFFISFMRFVVKTMPVPCYYCDCDSPIAALGQTIIPPAGVVESISRSQFLLHRTDSRVPAR